MNTIEKVLTVSFSILLASCASVESSNQTPKSSDIAQVATPSVVLIKAYKGTNVVQQGSGFIVRSDGLIATNRHVIEGADSLEVQLENGEVYDRVYIIEDDKRRDIALLRIPANNLRALKIADDGDLLIGDQVYVIGNPMGLQGTLSNGIVSAKRVVEGISILQITAPISPGSSGGPVLNEDGNVVGIATLSLVEAQNINMAVPARYIDGLISIGSSPELFQDVAHLFNDDESLNEELEDLPLWAQVLVSEVTAVFASADKLGYTSTHDIFYDFANKDELYSVEYTYHESNVGKEVYLIAVCDSDCLDIDLAAVDPDGELISVDVEADARAAIGFVIKQSGTYTVGVSMPHCDSEPCGFAIQSFMQK